MRAMGALALAGLLAGCGHTEVFTCEADAACVDGDRQGVCEPSGVCSFPDPTCESGKRHGEYSGAGLAGTCVELLTCDEPCGPCETCDDGRCLVAPGAACTVECGDFVAGPKTGPEQFNCVSFASGEGTGTCNEAGQCELGPDACSGEGLAIAGCALACALDAHNCVAWAPVDTIAADTLCVTNTETAMCQSSCVDGAGGQASTFTRERCDADGQCVAEAATTCNGYTCDGNACATSCAKQTDCVEMTMCDMGTGTCQ